MQAVVDEFGPSDLSKVAADYDTATQKANYAPGNSLAQWVFGPGTAKSILGNAKAALPWSTQQVMALIVSFLHQHLGS